MATVYEITKERHSVRAASRLSLNVRHFGSDLCELNRLWNETWIEANCYEICMLPHKNIMRLLFIRWASALRTDAYLIQTVRTVFFR